MIRLSSRDAAFLIDVLEQQDLSAEERRKLLADAPPDVKNIGEALIDPGVAPQNADIQEAVESIRNWATETERIEQKRQEYADSASSKY